MEQDKLLNFVMGKEMSPIIKVIGVGGGGGNAVNHMYRQGIHDVGFVLCNTDYQAILDSPIQTKIQLGANITEGLGAGNKPEKARIAAMESLHEIEQVLQENTKMVFITAGMGGGTGTGSCTYWAKAAKDLGILTVGIVTIPFLFEGKRNIAQATRGR
jgi:cell division protein FtsZ